MEELLTRFLLIFHDIAAFLRTAAPVVLCYLVLVNLVAFLLYGLDKRLAQKKKRRIPEANLLTVAALYGALGAFLGMRIFRHKTRHKKFTVTVPLLLLLQLTFAVVCVTV